MYRETEKEKQLADGKGEDGGGGGAKWYDYKKAWPSIYHAKHSGYCKCTVRDEDNFTNFLTAERHEANCTCSVQLVLAYTHVNKCCKHAVCIFANN